MSNLYPLEICIVITQYCLFLGPLLFKRLIPKQVDMNKMEYRDLCNITPLNQTRSMNHYKYTVQGNWEGWKGDTLVEMTDGSIWKQDEYLYEYRYAYRPNATIIDGKMLVDGMSSPVRVRRVR